MLVKVRLIEEAIGNGRIKITSQNDKNGIFFELNSENGNHILNLLKGRVLAFFYATKENNNLVLGLEAPYQEW